MSVKSISIRSTSELHGTRHAHTLANRGEGKIKSRNYDYKVTYDPENQKFDVKGKMRKGAKLLCLVNKNYATNHTNRALTIAHRLNTSLSLETRGEKELGSLVDNLHKRSTEKTDGEHKQIAMYGGKNPRHKMFEQLQEASIGKPVKFVTIDDYNACLGLSGNSDAETLRQFVQDAKDGKLDERIENNLKAVEKFSTGYITEGVNKEEALELQKEKVKKWAEFLTDRVERIDVFSHAVNSSDEKLNARRIKNYPSNEINSVSMEKLRNAGQKALNNQPLIVGKHGDISTVAFVNEFFRRTSKLGLEFFAQRGVPVVFAYNDLDDSGKLIDVKQIQTTPWKEGRYRDGQGFHSEAITYSEMRHVERLARKLNNFATDLDVSFLNPYPI